MTGTRRRRSVVVALCCAVRWTPTQSIVVRGGREGGDWPWSSSSGVPTVCVDYPKDWEDTIGRKCEDYKTGLCTKQGLYGTKWQQHWGTFATYGNKGQTSLGACCACGGGDVKRPATCSYMGCPPGFHHKAESWKHYCTDLKCTVDDDLTTCCIAHPDVQKAVGQVLNLTEKLKNEVQKQVSDDGNKSGKELSHTLLKNAGDFGNQFVAETAPLQGKAMNDAEANFAARTQSADKLGDAAAYQILTSGYIAARDAEVAHLQKDELQAKVKEAVVGFSDAAKAWTQTKTIADGVVYKGEVEWKQYYADLNSTWPEIVGGIHAVNQAIKAATVPRQSVRWTEQSVRLASDYSQIVNGQLGGIDSQVAVAEDRAKTALGTTLFNRGRILQLREMLAKLKLSLGTPR